MAQRIVSSVLGIRVKEVRNHKALEVIPGTVTGRGRGKK